MYIDCLWGAWISVLTECQHNVTWQAFSEFQVLLNSLIPFLYSSSSTQQLSRASSFTHFFAFWLSQKVHLRMTLQQHKILSFPSHKVQWSNWVCCISYQRFAPPEHTSHLLLTNHVKTMLKMKNLWWPPSFTMLVQYMHGI